MKVSEAIMRKRMIMGQPMFVERISDGFRFKGKLVHGQDLGFRFRTVDEKGKDCEIFLSDLINGDYRVTPNK